MKFMPWRFVQVFAVLFLSMGPASAHPITWEFPDPPIWPPSVKAIICALVHEKITGRATEVASATQDPRISDERASTAISAFAQLFDPVSPGKELGKDAMPIIYNYLRLFLQGNINASRRIDSAIERLARLNFAFFTGENRLSGLIEPLIKRLSHQLQFEPPQDPEVAESFENALGYLVSLDSLDRYKSVVATSLTKAAEAGATPALIKALSRRSNIFFPVTGKTIQEWRLSFNGFLINCLKKFGTQSGRHFVRVYALIFAIAEIDAAMAPSPVTHEYGETSSVYVGFERAAAMLAAYNELVQRAEWRSGQVAWDASGEITDVINNLRLLTPKTWPAGTPHDLLILPNVNTQREILQKALSEELSSAPPR
ncbi:MAG: hypothetical protein C5B49_04235 [Bdellovibrio sp.]|nr:MAG: hypothetical protein C5B49_04235 [Bdellovibrio sp.]